MKLKWIVFFLFPLFLNAQEVKMNEAEIKAFKDGVAGAAKNMQSLTADFVQTKHTSYLAKPIETLGNMSFKSPRMILWKYTAPSPYSVIFRDNKVYINDAGKKKNMGVSKMFNKLNNLIVGSVSGDMFDEKEFSISYFKVKGKSMAKFVPKDGTLKKYLKHIELYFENNTVAEVKMIELSDDYTQIVFKNKVFNARIDNSVFTP